MPQADGNTRERLVEAARLAALGRLLGSVLHQMSTPLGAIGLRSESLAREAEAQGGGDPAKRLRYAKAISDEVQRCQELLAAVREFASPGERDARFDLVVLCRQAVILLRHEAMRRQVTLVLEGDRAAIVAGQRERLAQAVLALLANALDASQRGGRVRVEVQRQGGDAAVLVEDEGEGISPEVRLFEPFSSSRPPERGLGLGLMASRAVAEAHGGTVERDPAPRRGSRFVLRVPMAA